MANDPQVYDQFAELIQLMVDYADASFEASKNAAQPKWLAIADDTDSRRTLMEKVSREEINEAFKQFVEDGENTTVAAAVAAELQHDFIAGVARDLYHLRRSRLMRVFSRVSLAAGMGGTDGVLNQSVLQHVQNIVDNKR